MVMVSGAIKKGIDFLNQWEATHVRWDGSFINHSLISWWEKPLPKKLKCNIDATFFGDISTMKHDILLMIMTGQLYVMEASHLKEHLL